MFDLTDDSKKSGDDFVFELEKELTDHKKHKELKERVETRIQQIKKILRDGENQKEFDRFGLILHGYTSLLKVFSRFKTK